MEEIKKYLNYTMFPSWYVESRVKKILDNTTDVEERKKIENFVKKHLTD
jgi:hypothetical protein